MPDNTHVTIEDHRADAPTEPRNSSTTPIVAVVAIVVLVLLALWLLPSLFGGSGNSTNTNSPTPSPNTSIPATNP